MPSEKDVDALYEVPPERFTKARDDLAKRAKAVGRTDLAIRVKGLKKPSAIVWLVNQLARRHSREMETLIEAASEMRRAQGDALRGRRSGPLAATTVPWRDAVKTLVRLGRELLAAEKRRPVDASRVGETLSGASVDPMRAKRLARGTLDEEVAPPGFEAFLGESGAAPATPPQPAKRERKTHEPPEKPRKAPDAAEQPDRERREREEGRAATRERKEHERELAGLRRDLAKAERDAAAATRTAEKARAAADRATEAAAQSEAEAESAGHRAQRIRAELEKAAR